MATRELQSASACHYNSAFVQPSPDQPWTVSGKQEDGGLPCVVLEPDTVLRIAPLNRQCGGWDDIHFHPHLHLPSDCAVGQGMVVTLEAMARECVAIALSPDPSFQLGKTYVVHFGASGNIQSVIRRRLANGSEPVDVSFPTRVCQERAWIAYWIVFVAGKLYIGTGNIVGQDCIGYLDDQLYHQLRSAVDAVRFVGLGNSAIGRQARPLKMRNVCVTTVPSYLPDLLLSLPPDLPFVTVDQPHDHQDQETQTFFEEYRLECQKNKARAAKFGIPYVEPSPEAFMHWTMARRLRANPEKGFITGMDVLSPEELAKQEARKARFGTTDNGTTKRNMQQQEQGDQLDQDEAMDEEKEPLSILQAWDNHVQVHVHRKDPPKSLWTHPPTLEHAPEGMDELAMGMDDHQEEILVFEKIHLCSIDWAPFKQIRTEDVLAYFKDYGPSYVEWMGELSCNVVFQDKFSASRALHNLSQELPTPPPAELGNPGDDSEPSSPLPDFGNMGWRFCHRPIRKVINDRYGRKGTTARVLLRVASSDDVLMERPTTRPAPPPGFSTKRVLGPWSDSDNGPRKKKRRRGSKNNTGSVGLSGTIGVTDDMNDHPGLMSGLQSSRDGYSMEDIEAERAMKRQGNIR